MTQIFFFNEGSRASEYGIGTYVEQMSGIFLKAKDIQFNIVMTRSKENEFCVKNIYNINIFYIPDILNNDDSEVKINKYYRNTWILIRPYISTIESDKIILHLNYYQHICFYSYFKQSFPNMKSCFTIHYMDWCFKIKGNLNYFKKIICSRKSIIKNEIERAVLEIYKKEKLLFEQIDNIICLSNKTKKILNDYYHVSSEKMVTIYNGIEDKAILLAKEEIQMLKKDLFIDKEEKIILFVGRLDDIKGVDKLIMAFRKVLINMPNCRLILVGDGYYSQYLHESSFIWSKITFTGHLKRNELYKLYQIADVGVLPSFHEQCSYVAIEMMMHGIPLIVSTSTGLSEMVENEITGFHLHVIENPDSTDLDVEIVAKKIMYLLNNPNIKKIIGHNARLKYENTYTSKIMNENMLNLYFSI